MLGEIINDTSSVSREDRFSKHVSGIERREENQGKEVVTEERKSREERERGGCYLLSTRELRPVVWRRPLYRFYGQDT